MATVAEVLLLWNWSASQLQQRTQPRRPSVRPWGASAFSRDPRSGPRRGTATYSAQGAHGTSLGTTPSLFSTPGFVCNTCPEKWINFQRKCYYFGKGTKQWLHARYACEDMEGQLVSIHSPEEQVGPGSAEVVGSTAKVGGPLPHSTQPLEVGWKAPGTCLQSSSPVLPPRTS